MPVAGAIEYKYSRTYRYIKPSNTDPGTWRLSAPEVSTGGGGGGGGGAHDIDGVLPVEAVTTGVNPKTTEISLDFIKLTRR